MSLISLEKVCKSIGDKEEYLLTDITITISQGEFVSIMGPSGSGKSTLLGLIAGIDTVTEGKISIDGTDITKLNSSQLCKFRNKNMGLILQSPNLIDTLTALENIQVPLIFLNRGEVKKHSIELLEMVGLSDKSKCYPKQLSGGEAQRIAVARALACSPKIILADEPTGALDSKNGKMVIDLLKDIVEKEGVTVVMVTHDKQLAQETDRIINMKDGRVYYDE